MAVASKYAPIFISLSTLFNFTEGHLHTHTLPETIDSFSVAGACNDPESSILHNPTLLSEATLPAAGGYS
ncbi:Hypothetical protein GSB_152401 [Giardia duodenalis]|uniref:Uncharacterized protein n=1 Tax=Giardia intestinalis TaxID=5741 RepID=V6TV64_GIAIN|nr:Hypothetical protein GSB_153014 [Giardia intestinalis]ESU40905.1 Hypothetical protein GSB_154085 [Giardia intestinalis]ESU42741.1 Hypothetical protein GSB_152401 [Giardia intestinalis]